MSNLPKVSADECVKALQRAGFEVRRQRGSHIVMRREDPPPTRTAIVPSHGGKAIKSGTLRSIIKQAGLTVDEFIALLK